MVRTYRQIFRLSVGLAMSAPIGELMTDSTPEPPQTKEDTGDKSNRQRWLRVLALATPVELAEAWGALAPPPAFQFLRRPETGLALVRGRIGGSGAPFNLGEMTVTRCTVRTGSGFAGTSHRAGTDQTAATRMAVFDALLQDPDRRASLEASVIAPLMAAQAARRQAAASETAATRVEFFTLIRGSE